MAQTSSMELRSRRHIDEGVNLYEDVQKQLHNVTDSQAENAMDIEDYSIERKPLESLDLGETLDEPYTESADFGEILDKPPMVRNPLKKITEPKESPDPGETLHEPPMVRNPLKKITEPKESDNDEVSGAKRKEKSKQSNRIPKSIKPEQVDDDQNKDESASQSDSVPPDPKTNGSYVCFGGYLPFVVLAILVALLSVAYLPKTILLFRYNRLTLEEFHTKVTYLKDRFGNQNPMLWQTIKILGNAHIEECTHKSAPGPQRPLVFLLLRTSNTSEDLLNCLSKKLAEAFGQDANDNILDGSDIAKMRMSAADLNDCIKTKISSLGSIPVVIFTELGSLTYETASIFFKYCDNEDAPYPKAIFIFTLTLDADDSFFARSTRKEITTKAYEYLSTVAWKDGDKAKSDALIARLFNPFPLPVMKEESAVLREVCD